MHGEDGQGSPFVRWLMGMATLSIDGDSLQLCDTASAWHL